MDKTESINDLDELQSLYESIFSAGELANAGEKVEIKEPDLSVENELIDILEQRKKHRDKLLNYLLQLTTGILISFLGLIVTKIAIKIIFDIDVIDNKFLEIVAVSVFAEVIAVIREITKALWNEKDTLSSPIIEKMLGK